MLPIAHYFLHIRKQKIASLLINILRHQSVHIDAKDGHSKRRLIPAPLTHLTIAFSASLIEPALMVFAQQARFHLKQ